MVSDSVVAVIACVWVSPPTVDKVTAAAAPVLPTPDTPSTVPMISPSVLSVSEIVPPLVEAATVPITLLVPVTAILPPVEVNRRLVALIRLELVKSPPTTKLALVAATPLPDTAKIDRAFEST